MPGFVGIASKDVMDEKLLNQMIDSMRHEEWYKVDKYITPDLHIGRIHLGVFNPEPQPIFNEDKSLCIFMDGKIYNYKNDMNELKKKGHQFNVGNDPEFCLHLYEETGTDFVKKLNGAFVIVIYDIENKKLIITNDRYGLRPLYYGINDDRFLFASEIKAILEDTTISKNLDMEAIAEFFAFMYMLEDKTFFKDVKTLPPATVLNYERGNLSMTQYWDFNYDPDYDMSEEDFVNKLVAKFKEAVDVRVDNKHRFGISLSGGLDSRAILAAVEESKKDGIVTYTFGQLDSCDVKIAQKIAEKMGTKHITLDITPEMIMENFKKEVYLSDGLDYVGVSYIPPIHKNIQEYVDIAFDGLALDVTLGGSHLSRKILNLKEDKKLFEYLYHKTRFFSDKEMEKLFLPSYYKKIKNYPKNSFRVAFNKIGDKNLANKADHFFLQTHVRRWTVMGHVLLRYAIENSVPTYGNDLIDLIQKIPPELRYNHKIYQKFLKKLSPELSKIPYNQTMLRADTPVIFWPVGRAYQYGKEKIAELLYRFSRGRVHIFATKRYGYVNYAEWFRTNENWNEMFSELVLDKNSLSKKYLNQEYINTLLQQHKNRKKNNHIKLLYILTFELFLRQFLPE